MSGLPRELSHMPPALRKETEAFWATLNRLSSTDPAAYDALIARVRAEAEAEEAAASQPPTLVPDAGLCAWAPVTAVRTGPPPAPAPGAPERPPLHDRPAWLSRGAHMWVNVCSHPSVVLPTTTAGESVSTVEATSGPLGIEALFNLVIPTVVSPARRIVGAPGGAVDVLVSEWCLRAAEREPRFAEALCAFAADAAADEFRVDLGALVREPARIRYRGGTGDDGATPVPFPIQRTGKAERGKTREGGSRPAAEQASADLLEAIKAASREPSSAGAMASTKSAGVGGGGRGTAALGGGAGGVAELGTSETAGGGGFGLLELTRIGESLHAASAADERAAAAASEAEASEAASFANTAAELLREDALIWRAACPAGAFVEERADGSVVVRIAVNAKAVDVATGFLADADLQVERTRLSLSLPPCRLHGYTGLHTAVVPVAITRLTRAVDVDSATAKWSKATATLTVTLRGC